MAYAVKSEMSSANNDSTIEKINALIQDFSNVQKGVNNFISSSKSQLKGKGYNQARRKLNVYIDVCNKGKDICKYLLNNIVAANNTMFNFMEEFETLDDSKIEDLRNEINRLRSLENQFYGYANKVDNSGEKSKLRSIAVYYMNVRLYGEKVLKKLEELAPTDAKAFSKLDGDVSNIQKYFSAIDGIDSSTFCPLGKQSSIGVNQYTDYNLAELLKNNQDITGVKSKIRVESELAKIPVNERMNFLFPGYYGIRQVPTDERVVLDQLAWFEAPIIDEYGNLGTTKLQLHKKVGDEVVQIFQEMVDIGFPVKPREIAETSTYNYSGHPDKLSSHATGTSIDINHKQNPYKNAASFRPYEDPYAVTKEVVEIWERHGFIWGGYFHNGTFEEPYDATHFTYLGW